MKFTWCNSLVCNSHEYLIYFLSIPLTSIVSNIELSVISSSLGITALTKARKVFAIVLCNFWGWVRVGGRQISENPSRMDGTRGEPWCICVYVGKIVF